MLRSLLALIIAVATLLVAAPAGADTVSNGVTYTVIPGQMAGQSWQGPGEWTVDYERIEGGDPAVTDAINRILDDEAGGQVWLHAASASKSGPWTFHAQGRLQFRPLTISQVYLGQYNAPHLPNMPFDTIATRVFDSRSGAQIVWDNLFVDQQAGLTRLSDLTKKILPAAYPTPLGGWAEYGYAMAPMPINFKHWVPNDTGIELHFGDGQFGRGLKSITIPWTAVRDLIAPEFVAITQ